MMLNSARRCFKSLIQPSIVEKHRRFCIIYRNILNLNGVAKYNLSSRISNFHCQRGVSTVNSTAANTITLKDESREFMAVFPDVVRDLTDAGRHTDIPEANKWFAKVLQYNVPSGRKIRGLALIYAYKQLVPAEHLTPDNLRLAYIMAWCIEMLQAFFLLEDDIMDSGEERRGKPCWYKHNNLGLAAINDGLLLESGVYLLLRRHFRDKPFYLDAVEAFLQITHKTFLGQSLDIHSFHKDGRPRLEHYTMDRYNSLVKYKTAYYSFCLPVVLAMHMVFIS
ncbi:farnesyl pyrophosphate synthase-like [Bacillus rossius redtenbacheri]|uniref:farnesyl pyrophosphate synthase-like n=1 Tax=Bacillus rossius redtenbacheri TaxID=93214 RepID=UPI002FDD0E62